MQPTLADKLLRFFLSEDRQEEVLGDLHEEFHWQINRVGWQRARWQYWRNVLGFVATEPRRRAKQAMLRRDTNQSGKRFVDHSSSILPNPIMLRNYVAIAVRQLWKNPLFSLVNVIGLTLGLAVSTFIALYVWHEFHYDRFEPFADRTYRITSVAKYGDKDFVLYGLHESFGREVQKQMPEVEQLVRYSEGIGNVALEADPAHRFKESKIDFADASIIPVMGLSFRYGDPKTALREPGHIILSRPLAEKYFGTQNPVGKTILYDKHYPLTVTGVLNELPSNTILQCNALISLATMPTLGARRKEAFEAAGFLTTLLVVRPDANIAAMEKKLVTVKAGIQFVDITAHYFLEPLPSLHLYSRNSSADQRQSLYILLTISLVILLLAVINYVSLTTARATKRSREVGIRKAIGGQRRELMGQFFLESFLSTSLAFALSLLVLQALFPWANQILELRMDNRVLTQAPYWGLMLGLWLACSLLAGGYPALLLSGFRPAVVLKGATSWKQSGAGVRRVFTTVQFTASIGLLICSLVLYTQMRFLRTKNTGINRDEVVAIQLDGDMKERFTGFRDAVRQWAGNDHVALTDTKLFTQNISIYFLNTQKTKKQLMVQVLTVDKSFLSMMGVQWKHQPLGWDKGPINRTLTVYNQTVIREAGIKGNPLQQEAPFKGQTTDGVVADFHIQSLYNAPPPMMLSVVSDTSRSFLSGGGYLLVRLAAHTDVPRAMEQLKKLYNQAQPTAPFDYYFLDDAYNKQYMSEERLLHLFNGFTALTLLVACLGLLGLMTFSVDVRHKEIGVRKVLGASVTSIVVLLSKDFLLLIGLALLLASPLAWWGMHNWLQHFAYKIDIAWWMFVAAGGFSILIALLTIGLQTIRAARTNPVHSLRSE